MNLRFGGTSWAFVSTIHQCTSPPSFSLYLSPAFVIAHRLLSAACVCYFPRALTSLLSAPCLLPSLPLPCLRNQTQVCHCWGSNRGNPRAQLQKEPLKTTLSIRFWQLSLLPMLGEGEKKPTPPLSPAYFSSSQILHSTCFFFISTKCSSAQIPDSPLNKCSLPLPLSTHISARQGRVGEK